MEDTVDLLSQNAKTKPCQAAAYNMKSSVMNTVEAVNGLMGLSVMKAEVPQNTQTRTYSKAEAMLKRGLGRIAHKLNIHIST